MMNSNLLLSFCLAALLSLNTYHALPMVNLNIEDREAASINWKDGIVTPSVDTINNDTGTIDDEGDMESAVDRAVILGPFQPLTEITLPKKFTGTIYLIASKSFKRRFQTGTVDRMKRILTLTNTLLQSPSLMTSFQFNSAGQQEHDSDYPISESGLQDVSQLADKISVSANIYMYLTDQSGKVNGIAKNWGLCNLGQKDRVAIAAYRESDTRTAQIVAHEIGHILGMDHDHYIRGGKKRYNGCVDIHGGIMDNGDDGTLSKWSACSRKGFAKFYKPRKDSFCLQKSGGTVTMYFDTSSKGYCDQVKSTGSCSSGRYANRCKGTCRSG